MLTRPIKVRARNNSRNRDGPEPAPEPEPGLFPCGRNYILVGLRHRLASTAERYVDELERKTGLGLGLGLGPVGADNPPNGKGEIMAFDHEKLDVYQVAIEFVAKANDIVEQLPRGRGYLADQLQRAALSIVLNIAEGAGKFSPADKAVFYTRARGSATESAAVLDVCRKLGLLEIAVTENSRALLERIAQMLTKLIKARRPNIRS